MKRHYGWIFLVFMLLLAAFSCVKDDQQEKEPERIGGLSLSDAQYFFEDFLSDFKMPREDRQTRTELGKSRPVPVWEQGAQFLLDGVPTLEIPFNIASHSIRSVADSLSRDVPNARMLLVSQTDAGGEISFYTTVLIADDDFLKRGNQFYKLSLSKLKKFSGRIFHYDTAGELVGGQV